MGSIKKQKNGKYKVDVRDLSGKRFRPAFDRKSEAEAFISKIESQKSEKRLGELSLRKKKTSFGAALDDYLNSKSDLREGSIRRYKYVVSQFRSFINALAIEYVNDFTGNHATIFYNQLIKERPDPKGSTQRILKPKPNTVNFFIMTVKEFFQREVEKGNILRSPMLHIKYQKAEPRSPEYYTESELKSFFSQDMPESVRNAFLGLLHTGMRFGELANLSWSDVDLKKKLIFVRSSDTHRTKTATSVRSIPVNKTLLKVLKRISSSKLSGKYVFTTSTGLQLKERKLLQKCKDIASRAGIESNAYLHKFRHTYATHLVQRGIRIEVIQKLLGHARIDETMIYAHLRSDNLHEEVSVLDSLLDYDEEINDDERTE